MQIMYHYSFIHLYHVYFINHLHVNTHVQQIMTLQHTIIGTTIHQCLTTDSK